MSFTRTAKDMGDWDRVDLDYVKLLDVEENNFVDVEGEFIAVRIYS